MPTRCRSWAPYWKLAAHNDAYRAFCFDVAGGADADCYDNAEVIFGNLRLAARIRPTMATPAWSRC